MTDINKELEKDIKRLKGALLQLKIVTKEVAEKWRINKVVTGPLAATQTPKLENDPNKVLNILKGK